MTAATVQVRHIIAICSFVKWDLKFILRIQTCHVKIFKCSLYLINDVDDTPDIRYFILENTSVDGKKSSKDLCCVFVS